MNSSRYFVFSFFCQPYYGAIAAKLELVTHAWFEQKDFTRVELLREAYSSLSASLLPGQNLESQALLGNKHILHLSTFPQYHHAIRIDANYTRPSARKKNRN